MLSSSANAKAELIVQLRSTSGIELSPGLFESTAAFVSSSRRLDSSRRFETIYMANCCAREY